MSVKVTLEFLTPAHAAEFLASMDKPSVKAEQTQPKSPKKQKAESVAKTEETETETAVDATPKAEESASTEAVDYPTLQKAVFELAGKSRDAAASVASSFNVKTFKELEPKQWAEALKAVKSKIEELDA